MLGRLLLPTALVAVALAAAAPSADAFTVVLVAAGPAHHVLIEDDVVFQTCEGNGVATLSFSSLGGRTLLEVTDDDCVPTFAQLTGCQGVRPDGSFHCHKTEAGNQIDAVLSAQGVFTFSWFAPDFTELVWANMTRAGHEA